MSPDRVISRGFAVLGAAVLLALVFASPLGAQDVNNAFGGLSENSSDPIDIEADMLTVYDAKKTATFKGNVKAVQGTTTLRADELDVYYVGGTDKLTGQESAAAPVADKAKEPGAKDGPEAQINKIKAKGNVVITTSDNQTTSSDWAIYDVPIQTVTVGGNVVLSQGQNVLKGDRLVIDLKTGESRFENTGSAGTGGGRIRALFMPQQKNATSAAEPASADPENPGAPSAAASTPAQGNQPPVTDGGEPLPIMPKSR